MLKTEYTKCMASLTYLANNFIFQKAVEVVSLRIVSLTKREQVKIECERDKSLKKKWPYHQNFKGIGSHSLQIYTPKNADTVIQNVIWTNKQDLSGNL